MKATPMAMRLRMARISRPSTRGWRSFKCASNMVNSIPGQAFRFDRLWLLGALLQREINLVRHRRARPGAGPVVSLVDLNHHDDDVSRVLVGGKGSDPGGQPDGFAALLDLCGAGFGADSHARHEGLCSGAFGVLHVGEHGAANDVEAAPADSRLVANPPGGKIDGLAGEGILRFDAR